LGNGDRYWAGAGGGTGDIMAKKTARKTTTLAASMAKKLSIERVQLVGCEVKQSLQKDPPPHIRIQIQCNSAYDDEKRTVSVGLDFVLVAYYQDPPPDDAPLLIRAKYQLTYVTKKVAKFTSEQLGAFSQASATSDAWPYWREFVQSMTTRIGLPALTVPLFSPGSVEALETKPAQKKKASRSEPQSTKRKKATSKRKVK